jgi:predicted dehydrogenase
VTCVRKHWLRSSGAIQPFRGHSIDQVLEDEAVDAVVVATPVSTHHEQR